MIHGLGRGELTDRGQDPECITGQQHHVFGVTAYAGYLGVRNKLDRVGTARVLGQRGVGIVDLPGTLIKDNILKNGAEADRLVDLRLTLGSEINALGVAAALDVEDAVLRPAVLIIADQLAAELTRAYQQLDSLLAETAA